MGFFLNKKLAMKNLLFYLFFTSVLFSQNTEEKKLIQSKSDPIMVHSLLNDLNKRSLEQQQKISEYKNTFRIFEEDINNRIQRIFEGEPIYFTTNNFSSSTTIKANSLYPGGSLGLNVTGLNISAGVWDQGKAKITHIDFGGRVTIGDVDGTNYGTHATHVSGTICATGFSSSAKGIAYQSNVIASDWDFDTTEMANFGAEGYLMSNHSYGYGVSASFPNWRYGAYDSSSRDFDEIAYVFPYYQIVIAAGNTRNDTGIPQVVNEGGFDLLTGTSCAKNVLTVAAVQNVPNYIDPSSVIISTFSNYGPTDDGRIKPDISAKGVDVFSTSHVGLNGYATLSGTSMAAPAITGMLVMLQKHFNNLNAGTFMTSASVRGLVCHTAREAGNTVGPDYRFGWGLANTEAAAQIITTRNNSSILKELTLLNGGTYSQNISLNATQNLNVSICWTDPKGNLNSTGVVNQRTPRLINNLDVKVYKDGVIFYPWKLNPDANQAAATNDSDNEVDNFEKVAIPNAAPGLYTIQVTHKGSLLNGSQDFSLIANSSNGFVLNTRDYDLDSSVFVYPNPAENTLNYDFKNTISLTSLELFDITGKVISTNVNYNTNSIDISNLQSGVYFVKFTSDNKSVIKKFIKK